MYINGVIGEGEGKPLLITVALVYNVDGCSGCIPSNHHATVLEGCGGEGM